MIRLLALLLMSFLPAASVAAVEMTDLYRAETIVTGTGEPERTRGFSTGLVEVVVKLTGDARLADGVALKPWLTKPHDLVARFDYEDRMKGIPIHDEQGTRDRPHHLRMLFDAAAVDRLLAELDLRKWSEDRPLLAIWLGIETGATAYVLAANGGPGYGQRVAFEDTARRRGMPIVLPRHETLVSGIGFDDISARKMDKLLAASKHADALLLGTHRLDPSGYWDVEWMLTWQGGARSWRERNVPFDAAIKAALGRCALVFSGRLDD